MIQANGKVWEITVDLATAQRLQVVNRVSTMISKPDGVYLRLISELRPHEEAKLAEPNLEEALLATNAPAAVV